MATIKITNADTLLKRMLASKKTFNVTSKKVPNIDKIVEDFNTKYLADKYVCYTGAWDEDDGTSCYTMRNATSIKKLMDKAKAYLDKKKKEKDKIKKELNTFYNKIIKESKVNDFKTIEEKIKALDKYFVETYTYDYDYEKVNDTRNALSAKGGNAYILCKNKDKKGICCDFAETFTSVCTLLNIKVRTVSGNTEKDGPGENHVWVEVCIDDKWYGIDVTWDICSKNVTALDNPEAFNTNHFPHVYYNPKF